MNFKFLITVAIVILAVVFVPLIPNDLSIECHGDDLSCDDSSQYVSLYTKYIK
jgi:hypothetical protein